MTVEWGWVFKRSAWASFITGTILGAGSVGWVSGDIVGATQVAVVLFGVMFGVRTFISWIW